MADNYLEKQFAAYEARKAALKKGHKRTGTAAKPATNTLPTRHKIILASASSRRRELLKALDELTMDEFKSIDDIVIPI